MYAPHIYTVASLKRAASCSEILINSTPSEGIHYDHIHRLHEQQPGRRHQCSTLLPGRQQRRRSLGRRLQPSSCGLLLGSRELEPERQHLRSSPQGCFQRSRRHARSVRRAALLRSAPCRHIEFPSPVRSQALDQAAHFRRSRHDRRRPQVLNRYPERKS
jgi:hypothetical protein